MAKVKYPLFSGDASGRFGKGMIFRRGGIVSRRFTPRNPQSAAQQAQRELFKEFSLRGLTQEQADLLYAAIMHLHDERYLRSVPQQDHGGLAGLGDDDHQQYFNETRGDLRYLRSVPQQDHGGLAGLGDDDHTQYLTQARGDARYPLIEDAPINFWSTSGATWSYSSADSPSFVVSVNTNLIGVVGVGDKVKLTQTSVKYFVVTRVAFSAPSSTLLTLYGGLDYTLTNAAITSPCFSHGKTPVGFPLVRSRWTASLVDTASRVRTTGLTAWAAMPSLSLSVSIGLWRVRLSALLQAVDTSGAAAIGVTASSANNSESNPALTAWAVAIGLNQAYNSVYSTDEIALASKTTFYVNTKSSIASATALYTQGIYQQTILSFECAYL